MLSAIEKISRVLSTEHARDILSNTWWAQKKTHQIFGPSLKDLNIYNSQIPNNSGTTLVPMCIRCGCVIDFSFNF